MKKTCLILLVFGSLLAKAQSISDKFFDHLESDALVLHENGIAKGSGVFNSFLANFKSSNGSVTAYNSHYNVEVHKALDFEVGEIKTTGGTYSVMFLKRKGDPKAVNIEFLVIYKASNPNISSSVLDETREKWMELCNAHRASELVETLYTRDAYYYNRGRLLQGTKAISAEYGYMNSPNYSLKLTPKHVVFVNSKIAYEIGRCSGSYPLPYMLLWQKQENGEWKILLDSNY